MEDLTLVVAVWLGLALLLALAARGLGLSARAFFLMSLVLSPLIAGIVLAVNLVRRPA